MFAGALDWVSRLVGLWILYGVGMRYVPAVFEALMGYREWPEDLQKGLGHGLHLAGLGLGWWLVSR